MVTPPNIGVRRQVVFQPVKVGKDVVKNPEKGSGVFVCGGRKSEASEFQDVEPSFVPLDNECRSVGREPVLWFSAWCCVFGHCLI